VTLKELNEKCKECTRCRLRQNATQVVPGEGSDQAEIFFIGEAPGQREDEQGIPFVGRAGKFLDKLLESIDLNREDVFITNTVKCRPPNNRDPKDDEKVSCRPWLNKQIELIKPKIFVPLGRHAMHKFLPKAKISKEHGNIYQKGGKIYAVMYHPAVALYNGSMRSVLMEDFQVLKNFLEGKVDPVPLDNGLGDMKVMKDKKENKQVGMDLGM
jgi:DNA polymerase